jgi:hypothetical protein
MTQRLNFGIALTLSVLVAIVGYAIPSGQRPLNYSAMITASIPLAIVWLIILGICVWRYRKRGVWLLVGAPFALWWPIWMIFNHFPSCYYSHNCI